MPGLVPGIHVFLCGSGVKQDMDGRDTSPAMTKMEGMRLDATAKSKAPRPLGLLAELTHRCPLGCPYCSNPLALEGRVDELDTASWARVFGEAIRRHYRRYRTKASR